MDLGSFSFLDENRGGHSEPFSWKLDPDESFSDWTIEIEATHSNSSILGEIAAEMDTDIAERTRTRSREDGENGPTTVFHVHKCFLGSGERRSLYFERVFKSSDRIQEGLNSTSKIKLEESALRSFPIMLDYMYSSPHGALEATSESAVALRWLSTYFGIQKMFEATNDFINHDLSIKNAHMYLSEGEAYSDDKIVEAALTICSTKLNQMQDEHVVLLRPDLFSLVLDSAKDVQSSKVLSRRIKAYCDAHRDEVTADMLSKWTNPDVLPTVDPDVALSLLRHAEVHNLTFDGGTGGKTSSLKKRCSKAVVQNWKSTLMTSIQSKRRAVASGYSAISDKEKISILEKSLVAAHNRLDELGDDSSSSSSEDSISIDDSSDDSDSDDDESTSDGGDDSSTDSDVYEARERAREMFLAERRRRRARRN
uniref:BTB domain-containing protein n=1 Tax=Grammatophora oceanica TaxID=210454 RepID=A0A7S1USU3_9STRA|mmetsp:Transcript_17471/g.25848  ORF Transcript_17471/g.25848 Transcript_17471/m.25848 type:complete len:424 (+) Transcript_17471:302-1573(+)